MKNKVTLVFTLLFLLFLGFLGCKEKLELKEAATTESFDSQKALVARELPEWLKDKYANTKSVVDKYEFPDISAMNDWASPDIIQRRKAALQIPEGVLASISTAGLLETCLEYPYNLNMFSINDYQQGFNALTAQFDGYRELLKRSDLVYALLAKYYRFIITRDNAAGSYAINFWLSAPIY